MNTMKCTQMFMLALMHIVYIVCSIVPNQREPDRPSVRAG